MSTHTFPFDLSWTPQELVDAVPLRLFELVAFEANGIVAAEPQIKPRRNGLLHGYAPSQDLPTFRVR